MKNKNKMKRRLFLIGLFLFIMLALAKNISTTPDAATLGCHPGGYTITADATEIQAGEGESYMLEVTATGPDVVIDIYAGAMDNDLFVISPGNIIEDNSADDTDPAADSITVELDIEMPSESGVYTLRILSREPTLQGLSTALVNLDITVTIGVVIKTPLELFFDHNELYIGGTTILFLFIGLVVFQSTVNRRGEFKRLYRQKEFSKNVVQVIKDMNSNFESKMAIIMQNLDIKQENLSDFKVEEENELFKNYIQQGMNLKEPKAHGPFVAIAFILMTINIYLIITTTMEFAFGYLEGLESRELLDLVNFQDFNLIIHIILGGLGYMAGIVVLVGTYSNIPGQKLITPIYIMFIAWAFNYLYGIFVIFPISV